MPKKLDNLIDRRDFVRGDPEDIVHLACFRYYVRESMPEKSSLLL